MKIIKKYKDKKLRLFYFKSELKINILKSLHQNSLIFPFYKFLINLCLTSRVYEKNSKTKIINRCILTGQSRSVFRKFRLSRRTFKNLVNNKFLNGVYKK